MAGSARGAVRAPACGGLGTTRRRADADPAAREDVPRIVVAAAAAAAPVVVVVVVVKIIIIIDRSCCCCCCCC